MENQSSHRVTRRIGFRFYYFDLWAHDVGTGFFIIYKVYGTRAWSRCYSASSIRGINTFASAIRIFNAIQFNNRTAKSFNITKMSSRIA